MPEKATPITIEQLQLLPEDRRVQLLRGRPEDQWCDRKGARIPARELGDALIGFANADGGLIAIGFDDDEVEGIARGGDRLMNEWRQAAMNFTEPPVRHKFELISCVNAKGKDDQLVLLEIEVSDHVHRNVKGEAFLRIGDENRRLGPRELQELEFDKGQSIFDGQQVPHAQRSDLDDTKIREYIGQLLPPPPDERIEDALEARGLLVKHRGTLQPSVAGILLLGTDPQKFFPEAVVRLLRYRGVAGVREAA